MKNEYLKPELYITLRKNDRICNDDNYASANGLFEDPTTLTEEDYD